MVALYFDMVILSNSNGARFQIPARNVSIQCATTKIKWAICYLYVDKSVFRAIL